MTSLDLGSELDEEEVLAPFQEAVVEDLAMLIRLHDRELDEELRAALQDAAFPSGLGLMLAGEGLEEILGLCQEAVEEMKPEDLPELAAGFAQVYLHNGCKAPPSQSPWFDEEGLERQGSMFEVRKWYAHHGLAVPDWRQRPDDHLVHQLEFLQFLINRAAWDEAARFIDEHLLSWLPQFATKVYERSFSQFYVGLGLLTVSYLQNLRRYLTEITGREENIKKPPPKREYAPDISGGCGI